MTRSWTLWALVAALAAAALLATAAGASADAPILGFSDLMRHEPQAGDAVTIPL